MGDWVMADSEKAVNSEGNEADIEDVEDSEEGNFKLLKSTGQGRPMRPMSTNSPMANMPDSKKRIIKALKKIQYEYTKLEAQFYEEVHQLECKYSTLYAPLFQKRADFISGKLQPSEEECDFPSDVETDEELHEEMNVKLNITDSNEVEKFPNFWLSTLNNVDMLCDMIQPHDEPILEHLSDIKVTLNESNPMGFSLEFHFEPNEFFENLLLIKKYEMKCVVEESDPFSFDGPEIFKCHGCNIDWKPGKDVTVRTVTKKQKHRNSGSVRVVKKTVINDSFFNFFNPPTTDQEASSEETIDGVTQDLLSADFEIGHFLRERLVPRAVLFYTGEAVDLDEDLDCEGEEEEFVEEDEEEEN